MGCSSKNETPEELSFFAMDTYMTLKVYRDGATKEEAWEALKLAKAEILRLEALLSVNDPDSEVAALNRGETVEKASADLVRILQLATELYERSDGRYDLSVYPLLVAWGFTTDKGLAVPAATVIEEAMRQIDFSKVSMVKNSDGHTVNAGGVKLDLGSIAKGYAGQKAIEILKAQGFESAIIILGGNVQTLGKKPNGSGFTVGIADPASPDELITTVSTADLDRIFADENGDVPESYAVVTSGTYQRNFTASGKLYHHIMDVNTGFPCENGLTSVTVICGNGGLADGLSTTLFLLGYEGAMEYYREYGGFEALFITDDGEILKTDGLASLDAEN